MTPSAGRTPRALLAAGRDADVFVESETTVLRRYRGGHDASTEAALMRFLRTAGYPVPRVHRAEGPDLVLDRLDGPTLAQAVAGGAIGPDEAGRILADLLVRLHHIRHPGGAGAVIHLDLHPENVICTDAGPMVIDWRNATTGEGDLDAAMTAVILAQVAADPGDDRSAGCLAVLASLLRHTREHPLRLLDIAVGLRGRDPALTAVEIDRLGTAGQLVHTTAGRPGSG